MHGPVSEFTLHQPDNPGPDSRRGHTAVGYPMLPAPAVVNATMAMRVLRSTASRDGEDPDLPQALPVVADVRLRESPP